MQQCKKQVVPNFNLIHKCILIQNFIIIYPIIYVPTQTHTHTFTLKTQISGMRKNIKQNNQYANTQFLIKIIIIITIMTI